ncbi:MAG TPA: hypothetical protein VFK43_14520 [Acidimicrobiales bacterium]|nr:hypothetical protein [Acidimicrobiales bacterium]
MSTFWTPSGERPIPRDEPAAASPPPPGSPEDGGEEMDEELRAELRAMQEQMIRTPAAIVVANHCIGLVELAALHLGQNPPNLADAQLAIDALAGILDALGSRMGENAPPLRQALNQMRMAFVEAKSATARGAGQPPES